MIVAIFTSILAMIGAGTTTLCSVMYLKKWGRTTNKSLKPSATLGEQVITSSAKKAIVQYIAAYDPNCYFITRYK